MSLVDDFAELFEGRKDIFGNGDHPERPYRPTNQDVLANYESHLNGEPHGVYPMVAFPDHIEIREGDKHVIVPEWRVKWGCVDFDEGYDKSWPDAVNVKNLLAEFGITAHIEKTRSKGWHVWVFASEWVPARVMRRALLAACGIVGAPTKEINPKQESLGDGGVGNFVRLPYPGGFHGADGRQAIWGVTGAYWAEARDFVHAALKSRCTTAQLEPLAELYQEPQRPKFEPTHLPYSSDEWPSLVRAMLEDEPYEHHRSDQMCRIAHLMAAAGLPPGETFAAVEQADNRWGKYVNRRDREQRLWEIVDRAY